MRWKGERQSKNVEDRRGSRPTMAMGGLLGIVLMVVMVKCVGGDVGKFLGEVVEQQTQQTQQTGAPAELTPEEKERGEFVGTVLAYTEDVWREQFQQLGKTYREPVLVLFTGQVRSACGVAGASVGPFYCPGDQKLYIDLSFFDDLATRYRAAGDFAQAYVIAHEVGHHVQHELGLSRPLDEARRRGASKTEINRLSVRLELQADFLAGLWAHHTQRRGNVLEVGDIDEALRAATAIGDDRLQMEAQGRVVPDSFTHGTSAQRVAWFRHGFVTGDIRQGDTFNDALFNRVNPR
jgi:predicted metalloprotease